MEMTRTSLDGTCPMHFMAAIGLLRLAPYSQGAWGEDRRLRISRGVADTVAEQLRKEGAELEAWINRVKDANEGRPKNDASEVSGSGLSLAEQDAPFLEDAPLPLVALQHPSWTKDDKLKLKPSYWVFTSGRQRFLPVIASDMSLATPDGVRAFLADEDQRKKGAAIWDYERQTLARARGTNDSAKWRRPLLDALAFAGLPTWPIHVHRGPAGWIRSRRGERWFEWSLWQGSLPYNAAAMCVKSLLGERWTARRAQPNKYYSYFSHPRRA